MLVVAHRKSTLDGYNIIAHQQNRCNGSACFGAHLKWLLDEQELFVLPCYLHVSICEVKISQSLLKKRTKKPCIVSLPG